MKEMLNTKEVAEYLSINEKQVYKLIKERRIPATRITGKWLFPKQLIDEWMIGSARENIGRITKKRPGNQVVVAGSNDLALELLTRNVGFQFPQHIISISNVGSLGGLVALQHGSAHIAASHLLDPETGEYNISFIRKHFSELQVRVINLSYREQGLILKRDNPKGIKSLGDLAAKDTVVINRQEGSGSRVLFDFSLRREGIEPGSIQYRPRVACTHMEVALEVFGGSADAGIGIRAVAKMMGPDFLPLAKERFDLIVPEGNYASEAVQALLQVLSSEAFKLAVSQMEGYDTRDTAKTMFGD